VNRSARIENAVQILIVLVIGGMAGAASFTHVHDWTMHNSPPGTGGWFGWANAIISELTPTAAGLEIRRRRRHNRPVAYPMTVLAAAAALSLAAQVAQATPTPTGWLVAALPALAFLALTKLVLSRTTTRAGTPDPGTASAATAGAPPPGTALTPVSESPGEFPGEMLLSARMAAFAHYQATGQAITTDELAAHLAIPHPLAATLLHALDGTATSGTQPSPVTTPNGTRPAGSRP
jgi:hypothetical protein